MAFFKSLCCASDEADQRPRSKSNTSPLTSPCATLPPYLREPRRFSADDEEKPKPACEVPTITLIVPGGKEKLIFQEGKVALKAPGHHSLFGFLSC